jgi:23S rRNA (cytosine1962-C5)-methyltransferase
MLLMLILEREDKMKLASNWVDYEVIDASLGMKYERWGSYYLLRPDPAVIWDNGDLETKYQGRIDAIYHRSNTGGGYWENIKKLPERWTINYLDLTFNLKQMGFKHTGLFPEQATNWDFMMNKIKNAKRPIKVLNLFAYTGGATVACLAAGASVTHVDSSKGMVEWCKENVNASGYRDANVRYLVDDCVKFVKREIRRGNKYEAIIMDPPSYGRGTNGEVWQFEEQIFPLIKLCSELLSDDALFFLVNTYSAGVSGTVIANMLKIVIKNKGIVSTDEIGLPIKSNNLVLPCGNYAKWEVKD